MPWASPLTLPGYQVLVDTLELMSLIKGQAVPMSASQYRCASMGACWDLPGNSWQGYGRWQPTAADSLQPTTVFTQGCHSLWVPDQSQSEDDEGTRAGPLLSNLGVPGTHEPANTFSGVPCLLVLPVQSLSTFSFHITAPPCALPTYSCFLSFVNWGSSMEKKGGQGSRGKGVQREYIFGEMPLFCKWGKMKNEGQRAWWGWSIRMLCNRDVGRINSRRTIPSWILKRNKKWWKLFSHIFGFGKTNNKKC